MSDFVKKKGLIVKVRKAKDLEPGDVTSFGTVKLTMYMGGEIDVTVARMEEGIDVPFSPQQDVQILRSGAGTFVEGTITVQKKP